MAVAFFLSGMAGLMFEIVWFHRCGLVFGETVWSVSIVTSSFMAGLAMGAASVARFAHRIRRHLWIYAALELAVAVTGLALTYELPQLTRLLTPIARVAAAPGLLNAARVAFAIALFVVPATAMGATLPVLVEGLYEKTGRFGSSLGWLYGWNTLGGVAGVLVAEVVLVARVGVPGTAWIAASLSLAAAACALVVSRSRAAIQTPARAHARSTGDAVHPGGAGRAWRYRLCAGLAGGTLLALEAIWFRFLSMFVLNSSLAFSLMLAAVLSAIAAGGLAGGYWLKRRREAGAYASAACFLMSGALTLSYATFSRALRADWTSEWRLILWYAVWLTSITSVLSGAFLTLLADAWKSHARDDPRVGGWLMLANTSGATIGPLVATFALLPWLGIERALFALSIAYYVVGVLAAMDVRSSLPGAPAPRGFVRGWRMAVVAMILASVGLARFPFGLMSAYFDRAAAKYAVDGSRIVATREGTAATVFLMRQTWLDQPIYDRLVTNGFSMSGTHLTGARYMRYFVYLPVLLQPNALKSILVICYGAGVTAGAANDVSTVTSIDVAEISREILSMSDVIYAPGRRPLANPRVMLHLEDGRQLLQTTERRFDLITGEPPPPLSPGAANLYSREYFTLVYDRLAEHGMATYWVPLTHSAEYDVAPIIRAFCDVFADCSLWNGTPFDWILVGTRHGLAPGSPRAFAGAWSDPAVGPHLREVGFEQPEQIGATFLGDAAYLDALTAGTPPLTDDYPRRLLPTGARPIVADPSRADRFFAFLGVLDTNRARRAFQHSDLVARLLPPELVQATLPWFDVQRIVNRVMLEGADPLGHIEELHGLLTQTLLRRLPLWALGSNDVLQQAADRLPDTMGPVQYELGLRALAIRNYRGAASYLGASERSGFHTPITRPLQVYALCLANQIAAARDLAAQLPVREGPERHFWTWMQAQFGVSPAVP